MTTAIVCTALLGVLVFGLGFATSITRGRTQLLIGAPSDPTHPLQKLVRAHANTAEYAPMLGVLFLFLGSRDPAAWVLWTIAIATLSRYLLVVGMLTSATLAQVNPLRFAGALGTYLGGLLLCIAAVMQS
jgi:hypothetical protein